MISNPSITDALSFKAWLGELAADERRARVEFLIALAEFDRRELYLQLGYSTLWDFLAAGMHFCKGSTFRRTHAVKLLQRFPSLADPLRDGRLCLTTLCELESVLTANNLDELVGQAAYKTKEEVERLVASLKAAISPPADSVRRAPKPTPATLELPAPPPPSALSPEPRPVQFEPVATDEWLLRARLSDRVMSKLRHARELASHSIPDGKWETVLEAALDCFIAAQEKRRAGRTDKPRKSARPSNNPRHISAEVRRQVCERDQNRCTWRGPDGHVCGSTWQLELDHIDPDGPSTPDNLRLLCRNHNRLHAEQCYGKEYMDRFRGGSSRGTYVTEVTSVPSST